MERTRPKQLILLPDTQQTQSGPQLPRRHAKAAYLAVGYSPTNDNAARAGASRLLTNVIPVAKRIKELQAEALAKIQPNFEISRERIGRRLDLASRMAESENDPGTIVSSELNLAKVFGLAKPDSTCRPNDYSNCNSPEDMGKALLESVGLSSPSTAEISKAIELNDAFVDGLERLRDKAIAVRGGTLTGNAAIGSEPKTVWKMRICCTVDDNTLNEINDLA